MSRYTSLPPERNDATAFEQPKLCEIPGCDTLLIPRTPPDKPMRKQGKADVLVKDRTGKLRGICCQHYHEIANADGALTYQNLRGTDGAYDRTKVLRHWQTVAQTDFPIPTNRQAPIAKGLGDVLDQLAIPKPSTDAPDWSDRPW